MRRWFRRRPSTVARKLTRDLVRLREKEYGRHALNPKEQQRLDRDRRRRRLQ